MNRTLLHVRFESRGTLYFNFEMIVTNKLNSVSWTSENLWDDTNYKRIPSIVTTIVDTLDQYTANSTLLFSESKLKKN